MYQYFATVVMNSIQTKVRNKFILKLNYNNNKNDAPTKKSSSSILRLILLRLRSKNPIRHHEIAGTIENYYIDFNLAWWLLNNVCPMKHILYAFVGLKELTVNKKHRLDPKLWLKGPKKLRETDDYTSLYFIDIILLFCASGHKSRKTIQ